MSVVKYSQEEIEEKRRLALERRRQAQCSKQSLDSAQCLRSNVNVQAFSSKPCVNKNSRLTETNAMRPPRRNDRFSPIDTKKFFNRSAQVAGKCYMISNERFVLEMSSFVAAHIDTFKTISSRLYDAKSRTWSFHLNDYENLLEKFRHSNSSVCITGLPKKILEIFRKNLRTGSNKIADINWEEMDGTLKSSLMPFQREGICYGVTKGGCCLIADDMGLGKTIQALGIAYYFKKDWPLLIVAPSSVRYQWSEAIYNFLPSIPTQYIQQYTSSKDLLDHEKIVIISYDLLVRVINTFRKHIFGCIILDESHVLKSYKTARFKAAQLMTSQASRVILLSGTPALSRPIDLYSQLSLIQPNFMSCQEYGIRYCAGEKKSFGWDFAGSSNMQELQLLLKASCMIRRLKSDVLSQLPSKMRQVIILDPDLVAAGTKEMIIMSKRLEKKVLTGVERHNALLQYYTESSIARLKAVCNYVTDLLESKKKCLIYAHHQTVLDAICDIAESTKTRYIRIDGKTNPEQRKYQVDKFQECDDYLVAILSITAANAGITLTAAQLVVFAELFWNPGILCQAEDRVHRIGQDNSVLIQYLVAKSTSDDYMWPLIQRKISVLNEVGLDQNFSFNNADVSTQSSKGQLNLQSFLINDTSVDQPIKCNKVQEKYSDTTETDDETENIKQSLDLDIEDFNNCDWNEIE